MTELECSFENENVSYNGLSHSQAVKFFRTMNKTVVEICAYIDEEGGLTSYSGTGTLLNPDGLVLTVYHIIRGNIRNVLMKPATMKGYTEMELLAFDERLDLALLKVKNNVISGLHYAKVGDDCQVSDGMRVLAIGHPKLFNNSCGQGQISISYSPEDEDPSFEIKNLHFATGGSGAPIFNTAGLLIGVLSSGDDDIGTTYATRLCHIKAFLENNRS